VASIRDANCSSWGCWCDGFLWCCPRWWRQDCGLKRKNAGSRTEQGTEHGLLREEVQAKRQKV